MDVLRFRLRQISLQFWFPPAVMSLCALVLAEIGTRLSLTDPDSTGPAWLYGGGVEGSRSILSAVASSSIGVGGTAFSITIAALSYAAGSMGPRLLQNFTEDRGNQITLGIFLSTFVFSLYSLRSVTGAESGDGVPFIPQYNVTVALFLAMACVGALVYFFGHVTGSINTTQVVNLLADDLEKALDKATEVADTDHQSPPELPDQAWEYAECLTSNRGGYLQLVDHHGLIRLAVEDDVVLRLLVRPGDYVCPGQPLAEALPRLPERIERHLTLGRTRTPEQDPEYAVRLLAEVGTRALSPGTNDPFTAMDVVDRFGHALCSLAEKTLPTGVYAVDGRVRLVADTCDFEGLVGGMFDMLRQFGASAPPVTIHILETLTVVATVVDDPVRREVLSRQATRVRNDALATVDNIDDRRVIEDRYRAALEAASST